MDSYKRYMEKKEDIPTIAMKREKPVQAGTITSHLLRALENGMVVDFGRFPQECLVRKSHWDLISRELASVDIFDAKLGLKPIFEACQEKVTYDHIKTILALLRTGFPREPTWAAAGEEPGSQNTPDTKRPRLV